LFVLQTRDISPDCGDPRSRFFDPLRAAILHSRSDNLDEACWLIFLSIHLGVALL
jgi:hypothetical protein